MPEIVPISEIPQQPIEWLWPGKIPLGKISVLAGDPNLGKSFIALDVAARVSAGMDWPDESQKSSAGDVLLLSAEDDAADTIRPRLEVAGADLKRIHVVRGMRRAGEGSGNRNSSRPLVSLEEDVERIAGALLRKGQYRLVVIDPISAYLEGLDPNSNNEVRWLLSRLKQIAEESRVAMLLISHLRKSSGYSPAVYRTMGSLAFTAVARALWTILKDPGDPTRRLLLPVKLNLVAQPLGLAFRLSARGRVEWDPQPLALDADERVEAAFSEVDPEDRLKLAKNWLRGVLEHGRRPSNEIKLRAREAGISNKVLWEAKKKLRVKAIHQGIPSMWYWELPWEELMTPDEPLQDSWTDSMSSDELIRTADRLKRGGGLEIGD